MRRAVSNVGLPDDTGVAWFGANPTANERAAMAHSNPVNDSCLFGLLRTVAFIGVAALLSGCPSAAETPYDESDDTETGARLSAPEKRKAERVQGIMRNLERERVYLEELKRTRHPFYSERELRHQLQRNQMEQRRYKHEYDRLEHERLRRR